MSRLIHYIKNNAGSLYLKTLVGSTIGGAALGAGYGGRNIDKKDVIGEQIVDVSLSMSVGTVIGALIGATSPVSVPIITTSAGIVGISRLVNP
jgi:hypothetical protein